MAIWTDTHSRNAGLAERLTAFASDYTAAASRYFKRRRIARTAFNELAALSTRELNDIGIARSEIRRIALETARNAI